MAREAEAEVEFEVEVDLVVVVAGGREGTPPANRNNRLSYYIILS